MKFKASFTQIGFVFIAAILFVLETYAQRADCKRDSFPNNLAHVSSVQDGDTLALVDELGIRHRARLVGIDTPETFFLGMSQGEWAKSASRRLKEILPKGTQVQLIFDQQNCDANERLLVHLFYETVHEKVHVNRLMIEEGWAVNYCVAPNELFCKDFGDLVSMNISKKNGFLSDASVELPYIFRSENRETPFIYFVGHLDTKEVVSSLNISQIPIDKRVFFYSRRHIQLPYSLGSIGSR